jgi:predicted metalloprotease with PDZ domain
MLYSLLVSLLFAALAFGQETGSVTPQAAQRMIRLSVDASDLQKRLYHVRMAMPVEPGPLTLLYPQWIPGEHGPTGPITDLVGLKIEGGGKSIPWKRDLVNMFAFHVDVPPGVGNLDVTYDFISAPDAPGFSSGGSVTTELAVLNWNQLILYPQGTPADQLAYQAQLKLPSGWRYGTALPIASESGSEIEFKPAPLNTVIDSPVSAGVHYRTIELGTDNGIHHYLHLAGDSERAIDLSSDEIAHYQSLVKETGALFGSRHYRDYHFLLTMSDHIARFGLEHHESSDDRIGERGLVDEGSRKVNEGLLPHEFTHSWNGKFRRPLGLVIPDYSQPMKDDLLWVYEGLTEYIGEILTPRSGLYTPEEFRDEMARIAAALDQEAGRKWRPLQDTADSAQLLYFARDDYSEYRRSVDYYDEGTLIWLEADVLIRELSKGTRSLNDFCRAFHGGPGGAPALQPYTFDDVVAGLNQVQPYDWAKFLRARLDSTAPHAPLGGIENGGWKLVYDGNAPALWKDFEEEDKVANLRYSIGLVVKEDGTVFDVAYNGLAEKAGIAPATKIIAVNNRQFTPTVLRETVASTANARKTIEFLIKSGEYYSTHRIEYEGGEKFPHLERDNSKPDILSQIIAPLVKN